jgi:hypothetical protein
MKRFPDPTLTKIPTVIDFGAASDQVARVLNPGVYPLRIESAHMVGKQNRSVVLNLIEAQSGAKVAIQPLWVDGRMPMSAVWLSKTRT